MAVQDEKIAAAWRARSWLVGLKYQDRVKTFSSGGNFGLDEELTPWASEKIPNTLGRLLGNAYFKSDIRFAPYTRCYIFEDEQKRPVAAVWGYHHLLDAGTVLPYEATARFGGRTPEVFDLMEVERTVTPDAEGNITFPVSPFPLFFRGEPGSLPGFIETFQHAALLSASGFAPVTVRGQPAAPEILALEVENRLSMPFQGRLGAVGTNAPLDVPSMGKTELRMPLPVCLRSDSIVTETIDVAVRDGRTASEFKVDCGFNGFLCAQAKQPITVDGNADDWKAIPAMVVET